MTSADRARARMVDALVRGGRVRSAAVEEALRAVPRHLFLPGVEIDAAYADEAVAVQHVDGVATSSASQPSMVAIMLEQLALAPGQSVLEVGAGTGWNAALMDRIVGATGSVTSVDIDADLVRSAAVHLAAAGSPDVRLVCGDGARGHPPDAPYDRIVLTVGSADVRPEWVAQLAPGGRLLVPLAVRGSQLSVALDLGSDGVLRSDSVRGCSFIRLRGIGAGSDMRARPVEGLWVDVPEAASPDVDPALVAAALDAPGPVLTAEVPLGASDIWDGFGFWLALTEPGTVRLMADGDHDVPPSAVALAAGPALAVVAGGTTSSLVRAFGPGSEAVAHRVVAALQRWVAAGSPSTADLEVTVVPRTCEPTPAGPARVDKAYSTVLLGWPSPAAP
ncbi:MAG: protein-L-isoaspartate(D-aspartate) O-methyltransferase [Pseudonocardiales bacterium]|jgi:protein-L-isoaspartate(D-aspartate) O-methyltransferase|nr:protein-L-isoaspartate(D-aspartate) O-methyltransferase [Pseudonocardiales bacterium]